MHIVILHGYILQGTGSNIYVANVAKSWKELGHKVTVICQDRKAGELSFVDDIVLGTPKKKLPELDKGTLRVIVPDINNLIPVYVKDEYEGYIAKTMQEMSETEIDVHIDLVGKCLKFLCNTEKVDRVFTNHAILSPIIAKRALEGTNIPYAVKIHGSAIEFSLVPYPALMKYAIPGLEFADRIFAGTNHIENRILDVFSDFSAKICLKDKVKIVPPGMDPDIFMLSKDPLLNEDIFIKKIKKRIKTNPNGRSDFSIDFNNDISSEKLHELLVNSGKTYDQRVVDSDLPDKWLPYSKKEPIIIFFGKFLKTKGVGELLAMAPSLIKKRPELKFIFCGFGSYREHMEQLLNAFLTGDIERAKLISNAGEFITEIDIEDFFFKIDQDIKKRIIITGFLDHELLSPLLPLATLCIVPSKLAEAFGMVAVEAMAAGVIPICNNHSGLSDILNHMDYYFPKLISIIRRDKETFFKCLPDTILDTCGFAYPEGFDNDNRLMTIRSELRKFSVDNFSWSKIAKELLES